MNLKNWSLSDNQTTFTFAADTILEPGQYLAIGRQESGITLDNNHGDQVVLKDSDNEQVAKVAYDESPKGRSLSQGMDILFWTQTPTPGSTNQISM